MAVSVGEIEATLKLRDELSGELKKAEASVQKFGATIKSIGSAMTLGITVPLAAIGTAAFKVAEQLDTSFDDIRIGTGATGKALDELQQSFKNVFRSVPSDAKDVSFAITELSRRLDIAGPSLERLASQVLTLARITRTDINTVIPQATKLFEAWSVSTSEQSKTLDFLFKTTQQTGVSLSTLLTGLTQTGAAFRALGFDLETSAALIGQFEKQGINAEQTLGAMQIAARKFADANIPLKEGLQEALERIKALGPGTESAKLSFEVFGRSSVGMAEAIQKGRLNIDELLKSIRASSETIDKARKDTDGFAESWVIFRNNLMLALEPLGTRLLKVLEDIQPAFLSVVNALTTVAELFGKLPASVQTAIVVMGGLAAAAGPAALAVDGLVTALAALRVALTLIAANPLALGLIAVGGAAIYAANQIAELNARTDAMIQKQVDAKTIGDFTEKLRKGLQVTNEEVKRYQEALERTDMSLDKNRKKISEVGNGLSGLKINVDDAQAGFNNLNSTGGKTSGLLDKLTKNVDEFAKSVRAMANSFAGVDVDEEIRKTEAALQDLNNRGLKVTKEQLPGLVKQLDEWFLAGHKLPPMSAKIRQENIALAGPIANITDGFSEYTKTLHNHWNEVQQTGEAYEDTAKAIAEFNKMVKGSKTADILKNFPNVLDTFPLNAPPKKMGDLISDVLNDSANKFPGMLAQAIIHGKGIAEAFRSVLVEGAADIGEIFGKGLAKSGSQLSKFLGSAFGALSAIAGDLFGKAFNSLLNINKNVTKETREQFAKQLGFDNLGKLYDDLAALGKQGASLANIGLNVVGRKDEAANRRWMKDVEAFYKMIEQESAKVEEAIGRTDITWSKEMQEFINKTPAFGEAIKKQLSSAASGLTTFLSKGADATKNVADIKKQIADLDGDEISGIGKQWDELNKKLLEQEGILKAVGISSQDTADAFGASIAGIFGSLQKQGVSVVDALKIVQPAVEALQTQLQATGFSGGAAFDAIRASVELLKDPIAGPVLEAVSGLGDALIGLNNTGLLNQTTFSALTGQITKAFDALVSQGKNGDDVLRLMQGPLQTVWELQKDFGFAIDESTQALLDQAQQAGIVGDKFRDPMERMIKALDHMVEILEKIAIKFGAIPSEAENAANGVNGAFRGVNIEVPVKFKWSDLAPPQSVSGLDLPGAAEGIYATDKTAAWFGEGGQPELGGPVSFMSDVLANAMKASGWSGAQAVPIQSGGGSVNVNIYAMDSQSFKQWLATNPDAVLGMMESIARSADRHGATMPLMYR